jgi:hypothetical protein
MEKQKLYVRLPNGRYQEYREPVQEYDNKLYRKVVRGNKVQYEPCSMLMTDDLPEGVWVVVKHRGSKSISSGRYMLENYMCMKAGDIQDVSLAKLGGMERLARHLETNWSKLPNNVSLYQLAKSIVGILLDYEKEKEE